MAFAWSKTTPSTGAVAGFELKEHLKAQGWTVPSSSDGTTYNSSGDQITTGASGAGGMANTNAWFRIRDPAGVHEFTFQRVSANTSWRIKWSPAAKFTGGSPAAGVTPSATDESVRTGGGTDASPTGTALFAADNTYRLNIGADNAAPYGWWMGTIPTGGGTTLTGMVFDPVTSPNASDSTKYVVYVGISATTVFSLNNSLSLDSTVRVVTPTPTAGAPATPVGCAAAIMAIQNGGSTALLNAGAFGSDPIAAKDLSLPLPYVRRDALGTGFFKGISTLMRQNGTARTNGDTATVSTTRDRIVYGEISLNWDGSSFSP